MTLLTILFWTMIGGVISLGLAVALLAHGRTRALLARFALPFGAGALLAAGMTGLLPEALAEAPTEHVLWACLGGFLIFFVLERVLGWFHHHHHHGDDDPSAGHRKLVIIGDVVHNAIDGVAIGAAFLVSVPAGIMTAIAVAAHEIPKEIGDFGILLGKGMAPRRVVLVNIMSLMATVVMALGVYALGGAVALPLPLILGATAGMFIYVAASDIIPEIHELPHREGLKQSAMLMIGVVTILATEWLFAAMGLHG